MIKSFSVSESTNVREFNSHGFKKAFDLNMSQMIQKIVEEMRELYAKLLDNSRNVINESNYDELVTFVSKTFYEKRKLLGLKHDNFALQPMDHSTNNIDGAGLISVF